MNKQFKQNVKQQWQYRKKKNWLNKFAIAGKESKICDTFACTNKNAMIRYQYKQ